MATKIRRSPAQLAATARLVAANAARRGGAIAKRAGTRAITVIRQSAPTVKRAGKKAAQTGFNVARAITVGQSRVAPGLVGGYLHAKLERNQRKAHADKIQTGKGNGPLVQDPTYRLAAEAAAIAVGMTMTSNPMARELLAGMAGSIGAHYELYASKDGSNPVDGYIDAVKAGKDGISV